MENNNISNWYSLLTPVTWYRYPSGSGIWNLQNMESGIWNLESVHLKIWNQKSGIWNQYISKYGIKKVESGISTSQNMESGIWNLESVHRKIWNLESGIWNQYISKYGIKKWNLESVHLKIWNQKVESGISTSLICGIWNPVESGTFISIFKSGVSDAVYNLISS